MIFRVLALALALLLSTGSLAPAQEGTTPPARLRAAIKEARASGVLEKLSREYFLCSPRAGYSYRVQVSKSGIRLTEEVRYFRHHASFPGCILLPNFWDLCLTGLLPRVRKRGAHLTAALTNSRHHVWYSRSCLQWTPNSEADNFFGAPSRVIIKPGLRSGQHFLDV